MPAFVLMKAFENTPARYDGAMDVLTLGRVSQVKREIAARIAAGSWVLDVGCGTGNLAAMMAKKGAWVRGIDTSEAMLELARQRVAEENLGDRVDLRQLSAMELDRLSPHSFNYVVSTLVLSELSDEEQRYVLEEARHLLAPGGQLLVADEVAPADRWKRIGFAVLRWPLCLAAYLLSQAQSLSPRRPLMRLLYFAIELPLMLLVFFFVPPASRPLRSPEERLETAGFRVTSVREYLGGTMKLMQAELA